MIVPLLALALASALAGCDRQKASDPQGEPTAAAVNAALPPPPYPTGRLDRSHAGTPAPDVAFQDPNGRPARLADFGRPVLVNLWATWCGPCIVEMPSLDALARRRGEDLKVLALSQDLDGRQKVADFFAARRFTRSSPISTPISAS